MQSRGNLGVERVGEDLLYSMPDHIQSTEPASSQPAINTRLSSPELLHRVTTSGDKLPSLLKAKETFNK